MIAEENLPPQSVKKYFLKDDQVMLLQNTVFGLEILAKRYFALHPQRTLIPSLITQSPLELLFGRLKEGTKSLTYSGYKSSVKKLRSCKYAKSCNRTGAGNDAAYRSKGLLEAEI
jgi:hypothetical protein